MCVCVRVCVRACVRVHVIDDFLLFGCQDIMRAKEREAQEEREEKKSTEIAVC